MKGLYVDLNITVVYPSPLFSSWLYSTYNVAGAHSSVMIIKHTRCTIHSQHEVTGAHSSYVMILIQHTACSWSTQLIHHGTLYSTQRVAGAHSSIIITKHIQCIIHSQHEVTGAHSSYVMINYTAHSV
jgi:hypothetical protein